MGIKSTGVAIALLALAAAAGAEPADADLWVGLDDGANGFLIDEDTGDVWMTGVCLKRLEPATREGAAWRSRTAELVSVGRGLILLDQTFVLDPEAGRITVDNAARGGVQAFPAVVERKCQASDACRARLAAPTC